MSMSVDPTEPETLDEEQRFGEPDELGGETPEADAAEQLADWRQNHDDPLTRVDPDAANEADAAEQTRVVDLDEDDYR